jgi:hypothetical protein
MDYALNSFLPISDRNPASPRDSYAIRAKECANLFSNSFIEGDNGLIVVVEAGNAKNRKEATIPVPNTLATILRHWLATKSMETPLWPGL